MSGSLPMAIDARHLTYRYGQFTAVNDVTLQVRPGEDHGPARPERRRKTTMVRMLTTLAPVQQGELRVFGLDAHRQTTDIRSNIGYVPQQLSIEPALTGRQNVEWFARLYGVPRAERSDRVGQALAAMDLLEVADRPASRLLRRHGPPPRGGAGAGEPPVAAGSRRADRRTGPDRARRRLDAGAEDARRSSG